MFNDEDDEEATMGAVRYPVMPSLVALQQMRNRLHLAYLGKKLMKWTAMATSKELRRIAIEISDNLKEYGTKIQLGFILLARARYFVPHINTTVLECIPKCATITVKTQPRSVSGVKVRNLYAEDSDVDPYPYLGLNNGGMCIANCKDLWEELVKLMILIVQYKITFVLIEQAHKAANNNRSRIVDEVIPKIVAKIDYIKQEMELKERKASVHFNLERDKKTIKKIVSDILKEIISELLNERFSIPNKKISMSSTNKTEDTNFLNYNMNFLNMKITQDDETTDINDGILPLIISVQKDKLYLIKEYKQIEENIRRITNAFLTERKELNKTSQTDNRDKYTQIKTTKIIMPVFIKHNHVTPIICQQLTRTQYQPRPNSARENRSSARLNKRLSSTSSHSKTKKNKLLTKMSSTAQNPSLEQRTSSVQASDRTLSSDQPTMPLSKHTLTNSRQTMTDSNRHNVIIPSRHTVTNSHQTVPSRQTISSRETSTSGQLTSAWSGLTLDDSRRTADETQCTDDSYETFTTSQQTVDSRRKRMSSNEQIIIARKPVVTPSTRTVSRSQQTAIQSRKSSNKEHHKQKHSRITILDTPTEMLTKQSTSTCKKPSHDFSSQNEKSQSILPETSQQKLARMLLIPFREGSKSSNVEPVHKVPSKVASIVRRLLKKLPKKTKKQDLIVLKHPEDIDAPHDDFIPPVAGKKGYTLKHNIIKIEDLGEYIQSGSEDHNESAPDVNLDGEDFETGEWFEMPDVEKIFVSTRINVSSGSGIVFYEQGTGCHADVYSKHNIPIKQCSETHFFPVAEERVRDSEYLTENFLKALEHLKISQGPSLNELQMDKKLVKYLDDKFNSSDELDVDFREQVKYIVNAKESLEKCAKLSKKPNRAYEYIIDSKSSEESDELKLLDSMIDRNSLQIDLRALRQSNMMKKSSKSVHKKT